MVAATAALVARGVAAGEVRAMSRGLVRVVAAQLAMERRLRLVTVLANGPSYIKAGVADGVCCDGVSCGVSCVL